MKEFQLRGIAAERQVRLPNKYKKYELDQDYRIDILVENEYMIGLKAVEIVLPIHHAQIITYLKLANKRIFNQF
jgi:GxxExxY protein